MYLKSTTALTVAALTLAATPSLAAEDLNALIWCDHADPKLLEPFEEARCDDGKRTGRVFLDLHLGHHVPLFQLQLKFEQGFKPSEVCPDQWFEERMKSLG